MARSLIGYIRVSTAKQGKSGLGIEAQRETLQRFATVEGFELGCVYVEVETGKGFEALDRRPQLKAALLDARRQRCPVGVAKLVFISGLMLIACLFWLLTLAPMSIRLSCTSTPH